MAYGIIDADSIAYRASAAAQKRIWRVYPTAESDHYIASFNYKDDACDWAALAELESPKFELEIEPEDVVNAFSNAKSIIKTIIEDLGLNGYELHLTGEDNYRNDVATIKPYKGNRTNLEKPIHLSAVRDYLISRYGALISDGCEADDTVSIAGWKAWKETKKKRDLPYIISIDKDLHMVPGIHYDWVKKKKFRITEKEGMYNFYHQMITGDTTDNIQGIYRKGDKAADKILSDAENYKCAVGLAYACSNYEDPESSFEENARLLWMSKEKPNDWSWET